MSCFQGSLYTGGLINTLFPNKAKEEMQNLSSRYEYYYGDMSKIIQNLWEDGKNFREFDSFFDNIENQEYKNDSNSAE